MRAKTLLSYLSLALLLTLTAKAEFSGELGIESRLFLKQAQYAEQLNALQTSAFVEAEWSFTPSAHTQLSFVPFIRLDTRDQNRTHADIREAYWLYMADEWELLAGFNREFWGVTESRHLVNVINQIDAVESLDGEDYLGQLMFNLSLQKDYGRFSFYLMPLFRERTFSAAEGRLRAAAVVDKNSTKYQSNAKQWHPDFALRYAHYMGDWDLGLSYFDGTSRAPRLVINSSQTHLIAHYDQIKQLAVDLQYTDQQWLWKFEGLLREGQGHTFLASVIGLEYSWFQWLASNADLGFLIEHLYDGRDLEEAPRSHQDNDIFLGLRYSLNDFQDSALLLGLMRDLDDGSSSLRLEAERRLGSHLKLELEAQLFINSSANATSRAFQNDDFIVLRLAHHY